MAYFEIFPWALVGRELARTNLESNKVELNKNIVYESLSLRIRFHPIYLFYKTSSIFAQDSDCRPVQIHTPFPYKVKLEIIADNWDPVNHEKARNASSEVKNLIKCDTPWFCPKYTEEFKIASALFGCQSRSNKNFPKESVLMKCSRSPLISSIFFFDLEVSIQNGPCTDEVLETTEHAHHSKYHVSLL